MRYCTHCGAQNDDDAMFCSQCGETLESDDKWQTAPIDTEAVVPESGKLKRRRIVIILVAVIAVTGALIFYYIYRTKAADSARASQYASTDSDKNSVSSETQSSSGTASKTAEHTYTIVLKDVTWDQAFGEAAAQGGYLLRIDESGEFEKIQQMIEAQGYSNGKFFIGGRRFSDDNAYYWVDASGNRLGTSLDSSSYWLTGDPSYTDTDPNGNIVQEDRMAIFYYDSGNKWVWADVPDNILQTAPEFSGKIGYIIEKDS